MLFEAKNLACRRNRRRVFQNVAFALDFGDALFVIGPNGSGKSSLLRILTGLLPAVQGDMKWSGAPLDWITHRARLHYLGHHDAVKPELTVAETLDYWRALRPHHAARPLPESLGLTPLMDRPARVLSAGQRRRLALARLVLDDAPLWLLDEPTASLDDAGQNILAELLRFHRAKGGIAIIATHHRFVLPEAQELALGAAA